MLQQGVGVTEVAFEGLPPRSGFDPLRQQRPAVVSYDGSGGFHLSLAAPATTTHAAQTERELRGYRWLWSGLRQTSVDHLATIGLFHQ
jgi:hypothetical protein